ncbi:hypothetical protein STENM223S_03754 [Streptomyces tendae]
MTTESIETPQARAEGCCCACEGHSGTAANEAPETPRERVNRRWNEIMQETRVAQTGVQILFGFLLSVAFTPLFHDLDTFDHAVYVTTVISGATATACLIAPVSIHRGGCPAGGQADGDRAGLRSGSRTPKMTVQ